MELQEALADALAGRYAIERELGAGGMARVFLARDLKHSRHVAIKILRPELASSLAADRFVSEVAIAAPLAHPNILTLHDSGEAAGLLYYVMPFVEGGSLRHRLEREGPLPLKDVVRIARQVASALDYAHAHGVVHRDIKPENILMASGQPVVADFGLAVAISRAADARLTMTGLAVGTPAYISPEQAVAAPAIDGRADIYSLGCVLFEMVAGRPPFTGPNAQVVIASHISTLPPSLTELRLECPILLENAIRRALAKVPEQRFGTAGELANALEEVFSADALVTSPWPALPAQQPDRRRARALLATLAFAAIAFVSAGIWYFRARSPDRLDDDVIAVLPFHIVGGGVLEELRDGLVEILPERLPHAANVGAVMRAWNEAGGPAAGGLPPERSRDIARRIGAGQVVLGSIVRVPTGIRMKATLMEVRNGKERAVATAEGSPSNWGALVDTVANKLLTQRAGEESHMYFLKSVSSSALRAYTEGKQAYRSGRYDDAVRLFQQALDSSRTSNGSSTFVFAALGLIEAANYFRIVNKTVEDALHIAWESRDKLNARDRVFLKAELGPTYPLASSRREETDAWQHAVDSVSDRPETHFQFGDYLLQFGPQIGWTESEKLARKSFERAIHLDSTFTPALKRLSETSARSGDFFEAQRIADEIAERDSAAEGLAFLRWRIAAGRGDQRALAQLRSKFSSFDRTSVNQIWLVSQLEGLEIADAHRAMEAIDRAATGSEERASVAAGLWILALNEGHPHIAAERLMETVPATASYLLSIAHAQAIRDAIVEVDPDSAAPAAAKQLSKIVADFRENPSPEDIDRAVAYIALCALDQRRLAQGNADSTAATLKMLDAIVPAIQSKRFGGGATTIIGSEPVCPAILSAWAAALQRRSDAAQSLARLDSVMVHGPMDVDGSIGTIVAARLHAGAGDTATALAVIRRRAYSQSGLIYLAASLREEARFAAAIGDRQGAIRAYQHYLNLRRDPEPSLKSDVDAARAELGRLSVIANGSSKTGRAGTRPQNARQH
jgi:tetratricopeptide (TPR) repeat protein